MIKYRIVLVMAAAVGLLAVPALAAGPSGVGPAVVSDDPEPIGGVIDDGPDPISYFIADDPDPFSVVNDNPDPFGAGIISDTPDPISESACSSIMAISDGPDPISGITIDDPEPFFCVVEGPEPVGASIDDDPYIVRRVVCRIGQSRVVMVWVAR